MADDFEITDINKAVEDLINIYEKDKLISKRNEIIQILNDTNISKEEAKKYENELNDIILKLAKIK